MMGSDRRLSSAIERFWTVGQPRSKGATRLASASPETIRVLMVRSANGHRGASGYTFASDGLRFELKLLAETDDVVVRRIKIAAGHPRRRRANPGPTDGYMLRRLVS